MQTWPRPDVPELPVGLGGPVQLWDPRSGRLEFASPTDREARLYVCGITPYDATHLGHANTYVAFDTLHRTWLDAGVKVTYAQNVTDVDDPLLERAIATGVDWRALAEDQTDLFREDMTALRVLPPDAWLGVVESLPTIAQLVQDLQAAGVAYTVDDGTGDIYVEDHKIAGFGEQSGLTREEQLTLFAERGGDPARAGKHDPLDQLVWRGRREGEPSWESPVGEGRPGWHVECAAIARTHLGEQYDVVGGGSDLAFPHHEMSVALASALHPEVPAPHPVHAGMVGLDGEKMSKSKGNLVLVSQLRRDDVDSMAIRLTLLAHHYREDWSFEAAQLDVASDRLERYRQACARAAGAPAEFTIGLVREALRRDLDTPVALAALDAWVHKEGDDVDAPGQIASLLDALLGITL
ncbi:molecular chaperone DnaK [Platysternon megacephalum]|uniref:L-cysteine:1D-myo-inositol 2-amino-2-deoxy-alpha-D-glucopyranoside ligase n=1 Tax=Platysternon megacephalum TaxID=55544 RepID=A0A4D9DD97_9SAUR|nr:molecular chaperone DnaK [Platysternon megacephalum]